MALATQPRNSLNDENSHPRVKLQGNGPQGTGRSGLKQQQATTTTTNERRILSDISNTKSFGTPKPSVKTPGLPGLSVFRSENLPSKVVAQPPQSSSQKPSVRVPLRNIVNGAQPAPSSAARGVKQPSQKKKAEYKFNLTPEELRQAEEWAKEDLPIEQTHFTGQDMDALREKIVEAEIEETVAMVRNYRGGTFRSFQRPTFDEMESIYYEDGRLKPDLHCISLDEDTEQPIDIGMEVEARSSTADDPILRTHSSGIGDFDYPSVREDWHVVRDDGVRSGPTA